MSSREPEQFPEIERWIRRDRVDLSGMTADGARLVERRLVIRRRANRATIAILIVALACWITSMATSPLFRHRLDAGAWWLAATILLLGAAEVIRSTLIHTAENRIHTEVSLRVAADRSVPTWRRIGVPRLINAALMIAGPVGLVPLLVLVQVARALIVLYVALLAILLAAAALVAHRDVARPTLAVDETSLQVDDRWRSQAMYFALFPLVALFLSSPALSGYPGENATSGWVGFIGSFSGTLIVPIVLIEALAGFLDSRRLGRALPWARWVQRS